MADDQVSKETKQSTTKPDIFLEADRILNFAKEKGISIRLFGGVAVWFRSPSASKPHYARKYNDLDFVGLRRQSRVIEKLFSDLGYSPRVLFNKLHGDTRLMFNDEERGRRIDIFLDKFVMCHEFDLKDRLELSQRTISLADLLLTKLQIVEINKKDIMDIIALVIDNPIGQEKNASQDSTIETLRITSLTSSDWGVYKTLTVNLEKIISMLPDLSLPADETKLAHERFSQLKSEIEVAPKSFAWKVRSKVGEKVKWYELPEST